MRHTAPERLVALAVPLALLPRPGASLPVLVDPGDQAAVAIDWAAAERDRDPGAVRT